METDKIDTKFEVYSLEIISDENDDREFVDLVKKVFNSFVRNHDPDKIFLVKIDNWFDAKWRLFSGKLLGIAGIHSYELVIPPFIPSRVKNQSCFVKLGEDVYEKQDLIIHYYQPSQENLSRKIRGDFESKMFFWYSGNNKNTSRGSVMIYFADKIEQFSFYVSLQKKEKWKIYKIDNISRKEILSLMK